MADYFRLRQIALCATDLDKVKADVPAIFGVKLAYEDPHVRKYGLVNALFPFGLSFLEVVAPVEDNTAAGRFMERSGGVGGYMAIFNCSDPLRRGAHAEAMGVPIAHPLDHDGFVGVQLHPRQCRAAMLEFDRTPGEEDLKGSYYPAGGDGWQHAIKTDVTQSLKAIVVESPDAEGLGRHWARLIEKDYVADADGGHIDVDMTQIRFAKAPAGTRETIRTLIVETVDPAGVLSRAAAKGYPVANGGFELGGVRFVPQA
ncbi:VOC family protein [Chelatococcus reniformis]|uniref:Glyoxalase-like domain-containing protein n=1 Tax=Chelatococcus reniformis TaxID=1494448 RepID=A0A916UQI6_9HYPH|nr:VOC family protein [Chelatococcus reniformis]GGC81909.1 hypothetical protein GCM10010994_44810 [Chelatococcus reniformis]